MKLNFNIFNKIIVCFCLLTYILFGFLNTNGISVCYGSEHSKHIGLNMFGYETCCENESTHHHEISSDSKTESSYQDKCNCNHKKIVSNIQFQEISTNYADNISVELKNVNMNTVSFIACFNEKYNKINWNIYSHKKINNHLEVLNKIILII